MRIAVFGGSGFLGSHVADALSDAGHEVVVFDLRQSPYLRSDQKMVVGDILDPFAVQEALRGCDAVYNFAGLADLDDATTRPLDTVHLNVIGNIIVMDKAIEAGVKRFIYASSIYVYSQKGGFYRCSKQSSELYIEEYQRRYGLHYTILRYGTLYGPRANDKNSIFRHLRQAVEESTVTCGGSGEERREYIDVRDAARLSATILAPDYANRHLIISGQQSMRFHDLVKMIGEILDKPVDIVYAEGSNPHHYSYTPYSYAPRAGQKIVNHLYLDMGQGLLECLQDMYDSGQW